MQIILLFRIPIWQFRECNTLECVFRPVFVEVNGGAVDQRGEVKYLSFEAGGQRAHAEHDVQVALDCDEVLVVQVEWTLLEWFILAVFLCGKVDFLQILCLLEIRHVAAVQYVVHVLKHYILNDLVVLDQEASGTSLRTCGHQNYFNVWLPVFVNPVVLHNFNVVEFVIHDLIR